MLTFKKSILALVTLNFLALPVTAELLYLHYKPGASDFCVLSDRFNCDIVNQSIYSEFLGIPVAILGLLAYSLLLAISVLALRRDLTKFLPWILAFSSLCLAFALYLTGIEFFVLKTFCIFCLAQQIIILLETLIWGRLFFKTRIS